jgi:hypothetical protein
LKSLPQVVGSATTLTCTVSSAFSSCGFARVVIIWKSGM